MIRRILVAAACTLTIGAAAEDKPALAAENIVQAQPQGLKIVVIRDKRRGDTGRRVARLEDPWIYCSPVNDTLYVVPEGYVTDFASVPGLARMVFPQFGEWAEAAVIHDWLYDIGEPGKKVEADTIFRKAIEEQAGKGLASSVMYLAVRAGGHGAYRKAMERNPEDWASHFVDEYGEEQDPPFRQPETGVWKVPYDCRLIEDADIVAALLKEYEESLPRR